MVSVLLEPLPGIADERVVALLQRLRAREVERLAPGFISAEVARSELDELRKVAEVTEKALKQSRAR